MEESPQSLNYPDSELVIALVAPVGANLETFELTLRDRLTLLGYQINSIRLSEILKTMNLGVELKETPAAERLNTYMTAGNRAREQARRGDIVALYAAHNIYLARPERSQPLPKVAHVLRSLKHPQEVWTLRRIYGSGFFLIGVSVSETERRDYLMGRKGCSQEEIDQLIRRDENEENEFGQKMRDTFQLADVFIPQKKEEQLWRFLDLVFGAPFETPTPDEYAMFMAFAASLRSADLSRQVGAVIMSARREVVATGTNDVPAFGGGLYWPGEVDARDWKRGVDENERQRDESIIEVMKKLSPAGSSISDEELLSEGKKRLAGVALLNVTEFGRAVHAEMEALLSCARSGISPADGTLYTTTFPCHNCAKHIVASGVKRVVYVQPYPKSQALKLHGDSIALANVPPAENKVIFEPFCGVGPRRFFDLFSVGLSSGYRVNRKKGGKAVEWKRDSAQMRVPMLPNSYIEREKLAISELNAVKEEDEQ